MKGKGEESYLAAFKLHVTGALCRLQAATREDLQGVWSSPSRALCLRFARCMLQGTSHSSGLPRRSSSRTRLCSLRPKYCHIVMVAARRCCSSIM